MVIKVSFTENHAPTPTLNSGFLISTFHDRLRWNDGSGTFQPAPNAPRDRIHISHSAAHSGETNILCGGSKYGQTASGIFQESKRCHGSDIEEKRIGYSKVD